MRFRGDSLQWPGDSAARGGGPRSISPGVVSAYGFRFDAPVDGAVTISIYDFANQLVRELWIDEPIEAGVPYTTVASWDGFNGKGDLVAIGTYFYVIEYSNGDTDWGKIAVIH